MQKIQYRSIAPAARKCAEFVKQLLFPGRCPVCDAIVVPWGEKICLECIPKLKLLTPPWCMKCGKKMYQAGELCEDCSRTIHCFDRGRALYEYNSAAPSIYRLKYGGRQEYAVYFGEEMARLLRDFIESVRPDGLVPVPLHRARKNRRGYNQAELLAKALGRAAGVPVYDKLVVRTRNTQPLKRLNPQERQNNLKKAFNMAQNDVKLKTIIVVDDIYTTGSTIDEIAGLLKANGAERVYFVTVACGAGM